MPLYEVAVMEAPTKKAAEDGAGTKLIFGPVAIVANDESGAILEACLENADSLKNVPKERRVVVVRPFCE